MKHVQKKTAARVAAAAAALMAVAAHAYEFTWGDVQGSFVSQIAAGASIRLKSQDPNLIAAPGSGGFYNSMSTANRGDLNYNKYDLFAEYFKGNHELLLKFSDGYKFMVRGAWLHDFKADDTRFAPLLSSAHVQVARDIRLLDLWMSKDFSIGAETGRIRLGNQVVSWGESLFVPGGINQANGLDLQRLTLPGIPLKEVVQPAPMLSFATSLGSGFNVEAYYQFIYESNRLIPAGTYFSAGNAFGNGRIPLYYGYDPASVGVTLAQAAAGIPGVGTYVFKNPDGSLTYGNPLLPDKRPPNGGEWGASLHYKPEGRQIDFGAYYMIYHDKNPYLQFLPTTRGAAIGYDAQEVFPSYRRMAGLSTDFTLGNWAYGLELSYRPKDPILVDPFSCADLGGAGPGNCNGDLRTWRDTERYQLHGTWWRLLNPSDPGAALVRWLGAQGSTVQGEVVAVDYPGIHKTGVFDGISTYSNLGTNCAAGQVVGCQHFGTRTSWGFIAYFDLTYDGTLIKGWQVNPNITISRGMKGDTPNENYTWSEHNQSIAAGINFTKNPPVWQVTVSYVTYNGGNPVWVRNVYKDRDWLGVVATRNF